MSSYSEVILISVWFDNDFNFRCSAIVATPATSLPTLDVYDIIMLEN